MDCGIDTEKTNPFGSGVDNPVLMKILNYPSSRVESLFPDFPISPKKQR